MLADKVDENLNVLVAMVTDIVNSLPDGEPTNKNFHVYHSTGKILVDLGRSLMLRGYQMDEYYHAFMCGDYDND